MATTLSVIAKFENNRRKESQKQRIQAAQRKGKYQERKTIINKTLIQKVKYLKETKNLSVSDKSKLSYHLQSLKRAFRLRIKLINQIGKRISKIKGRSTLKKCRIEKKISLERVTFTKKSTQSTLLSIPATKKI